MSTLPVKPPGLPPQQQAIRDKCFHPTGTFTEFRKEDIEQSIPDRFEEQVRKYPDRIAVKTRSEQLTYDQLNTAANRVANALLAQQGVGPEPVVLLLEQGVTLVAAILGVLKAGKFYVPLDPSFTRARTAYMLEHSQAPLIVTNSKNLSSAYELALDRCQWINVDDLDSRISTGNPSLAISPDTLAFITYTSGSTGQPKGVVHNHRNVLHFTMILTNGFHICSHDRLTQLRPVGAFGTSKEIFLALLNGAAVFPFDIREEGLANLANWLILEQITIYRSVPRVFREFVSALAGGEQFPKLRLINMGGESMYKGDVERYKKHFSPDCVIVHVIGPTETDTFRWYFIDKKTEITRSIVPVGYPVEDIEVLLLDGDGQEIGSNQTGEIVVRSRYLSPGYWKRPDLTQAAFLPDPDGGDQRTYLTGDLGRMLPDGCLEHLGRNDFQVKIRGFRVEVAEIEMALLDLDVVQEAVVVAQEDTPGDKRLVAYIVQTGKPAPTVSALRRALEERLPAYMVPSAFVFLDALPTLPTGKVDHRALPAPGSARPALVTSFVGPRTPVEQGLAGIWSEVLDLDGVGVEDNFLELGGDSLLAGRVIVRVIETFQVEVPLRSLWESPTIADMAVIIVQGQVKAADPLDIERMLQELESLPEA